MLNGGGAASDSDVLVLDDTLLGSGPVRLSITNAVAGQGAPTDRNGNGVLDTGEGILVVEVLGASAANLFTLSPVREGDFLYTVEQGADGNWYLVSSFSPTPPPSPPPAEPIPALPWAGLLGLLALVGLVARRRLRILPPH